MAEPAPPTLETNLNESDSEFLSALEQIFITPSSISNELDVKPQHIEQPSAESNIVQTAKLPPLTPIQTPPIPTKTDLPRIETFLHTPSIKQTSTSTVDQKLIVEASIDSKSTSNNSPNNIHHQPNTKYTIALWLATGSLIIAGIAIWQLNELYEHIFRLETLNKTLESKLLETLTRIDLIKNNFTRIETILHQLEASSAITNSITPTEP